MELKGMKVIVIGLGKSGFELLGFLDRRQVETVAYDSRDADSMSGLERFSDRISFRCGQNPSGDEECDLVIVSPGISMNLDFMKRFRERKVEIAGEVEFAYNFAKGKFISITGTNGKTTSTTLAGEIFKAAGFDTRVVGNIGNPVISEVETSTEETVFVAEISSFQLETIKNFNSRAAAVINITPDHLDRHITVENYADVKSRIFENQTKEDFAIINYDDPAVKKMSESLKSQIIFFSRKEKLEKGIYIEDGIIKYADSSCTRDIISREEVFLKGGHNLENVMATIGLCIAAGIDQEVMKRVLREFRGVEHRLELVDCIDGVEFINDSKGTNTDSSIKALEAYDHDVILIAGGYDKKAEFGDFVKMFSGRVKHAIFMGATSQKLADACIENGYTQFSFAQSMKESVELAKKLARLGDTVLLSPACASWGMYNNFEQRGEDFKNNVRGNV